MQTIAASTQLVKTVIGRDTIEPRQNGPVMIQCGLLYNQFHKYLMQRIVGLLITAQKRTTPSEEIVSVSFVQRLDRLIDHPEKPPKRFTFERR